MINCESCGRESRNGLCYRCIGSGHQGVVSGISSAPSMSHREILRIESVRKCEISPHTANERHRRRYLRHTDGV